MSTTGAHSGGGAARDFGFGFEKGAAQFDERVASEQRPEKQAVRPESSADLDEGAGQIVRPVQREAGRDQVERVLGEREAFVVGDHRRQRPAASKQTFRQVRRDLSSRARRGSRMAASHVQPGGKWARDVLQALVETGGDFPMKEVVLAADAGRAVAVTANGASIEEGEVVGHKSANRRASPYGIARDSRFASPFHGRRRSASQRRTVFRRDLGFKLKGETARQLRNSRLPEMAKNAAKYVRNPASRLSKPFSASSWRSGASSASRGERVVRTFGKRPFARTSWFR